MRLADLTPDLIDGLQPGPETDALVAEAMGAEIVTDYGALGRAIADDLIVIAHIDEIEDGPTCFHGKYMFTPSREINSAMEAVRSLDGPDQFAMFAALQEADGHAHPLWMLLFEWDNPALELCRAYLKARLAEGGR